MDILKNGCDFIFVIKAVSNYSSSGRRLDRTWKRVAEPKKD